MTIGLNAINKHKREPSDSVKDNETLRDYQKRQKKVKSNKSEHEILTEMNKIFL